MALFAPLRLLWMYDCPQHVQVTQRKQHIELTVVLLDALVARLLVMKQVLVHVKRMLNPRAHLRLQLLVGLRHRLLPTFGHLGYRAATLNA